MRKQYDFGWTEDIGDGFTLSLCRLSDTTGNFGITKQKEFGRGRMDGRMMRKLLADALSRFEKEFVPEGEPYFVGKVKSDGASADPIDAGPTVSWVYAVKLKGGRNCHNQKII